MPILENWVSHYINTLYWAVVTMITLGYGDIVPQTIPEKIYVIFTAMIGCGIFAYSVNKVGMIINDMNKKSSELRSKIALLSAHMKRRGVNKEL